MAGNKGLYLKKAAKLSGLGREACGAFGGNYHINCAACCAVPTHMFLLSTVRISTRSPDPQRSWFTRPTTHHTTVHVDPWIFDLQHFSSLPVHLLFATARCLLPFHIKYPASPWLRRQLAPHSDHARASRYRQELAIPWWWHPSSDIMKVALRLRRLGHWRNVQVVRGWREP